MMSTDIEGQYATGLSRRSIERAEVGRRELPEVLARGDEGRFDARPGQAR